jgi:hypothetical protein
MIIVKLMGGIGNQMFQYATARRLAHVRGAALKLDLGWFENCIADSPRAYELHLFRIKELIASVEEIRGVKNAGEKGAVCGLMRFLGVGDRCVTNGVVVERHFHFDPEVLRLPDNVYLDGYWQSEKYFADVADVVRSELTVAIEPDDKNRQMSEMIRKSEAVSLHIRRGDYVSNPVMNRFHGLCSLEYYQKGMEMVFSKTKNAHFFVFSDDPAWAKENVNSDHPLTFIDFNGAERAYEDLRLMSLCKHHVIANSSFSWWGAWLSRNPSKVVVAPAKWFSNPNINTDDLIPQGWVRL